MTSAVESRQWSGVDKAALALSVLLLVGGLVVSLVINDWIALLAAAGLVIVPAALVGTNRRQGRRST